MGMLFGESVRGAAGYAPLVVRVLVGVIMAAHGWQKLQAGPSGFGQALAGLGVPLPEVMAYVVTFVELIGGILLIVGLFSRVAALLLTINLVVAILLVKVNIGLLSPPDGSGVGAELDLALIAGFLVVLLAGPGRLSVDQALGYEGDLVQEAPTRPRGRRRSSSRRGISSR
jgi:putative oxidoreductase